MAAARGGRTLLLQHEPSGGKEGGRREKGGGGEGRSTGREKISNGTAGGKAPQLSLCRGSCRAGSVA